MADLMNIQQAGAVGPLGKRCRFPGRPTDSSFLPTCWVMPFWRLPWIAINEVSQHEPVSGAHPPPPVFHG